VLSYVFLIYYETDDSGDGVAFYGFRTKRERGFASEMGVANQLRRLVRSC
jgi:hypothetical protein